MQLTQTNRAQSLQIWAFKFHIPSQTLLRIWIGRCPRSFVRSQTKISLHGSVYSRSLKSNSKLRYLTVTLINMPSYSCSNPSVISIILQGTCSPVARHTVTNKIQFAQICLWIRSLIMPHSSAVMNLGSNGAGTKKGTRACTVLHFIPMIE